MAVHLNLTTTSTLFCLLLLGCDGPIPETDAGPAPEEEEAIPEIGDICDDTVIQFCDGDLILFCSEEAVQSFGCRDEYETNRGHSCGPRLSCVDDGTSNRCEEIGVGCIGIEEGAACTVQLNDHPQQILCDEGLGCILSKEPDGDDVELCTLTTNCTFGARHAGCVGEIATFCTGDAEFTVLDAAGIDCSTFENTFCKIDEENNTPFAGVTSTTFVTRMHFDAPMDFSACLTDAWRSRLTIHRWIFLHV